MVPTDRLEGRAREIIDAPNHVTVSIARPDGSVQSIVAWAALEDGNVALNSAVGRSWPTNLLNAGRATVLAFADGNPHEWVSVEGELVHSSTEDGVEHDDLLARKYLGTATHARPPGQERIRMVLRPTRVVYLKQD